MITVKKSVLALAAVIVLGMFSGCGSANNSVSETAPKDLSVISVYNTITGDIITLGDTRQQVEKITGSVEADIMEFEEDGVRRVSYWDEKGEVDTEGVTLDYLDDKVVAIRLTYETYWQIVGGAYPTMPHNQVEKIYENNMLRAKGSKGGVFLAYDKELTPVPYSNDAPYTVRLTYKDNLLDIIVIQDNVTY